MKLLLCAFLFIIALSVQAATAPFHPYEEVRFKAIEDNATLIYSNTAATVLPKVARMEYTITSLATGATFVLGTLPANAVIVKSFVDVVSDVLPVNASNTVSIGCESAVDLMAATDISAASSDKIYTGAVTAPANYVTSDGCSVTGTVGSAAGSTPLTAGKIILFTEYLIGE